jgi:hypothetical protein
MCGGLFGGSSKPDLQPLPPAPKASDADVEAAAQKERELARLRKSRKSTILTQMATDNSGNKTLLGQ